MTGGEAAGPYTPDSDGEGKSPFNDQGGEWFIVMTERVEGAMSTKVAVVPDSSRKGDLTVDERGTLSESMKRHHRAMGRLANL